MKKLKLGPYVLDSTLQIDESTALEARGGASLSDLEERMDFADHTFNDDSRLLSLKGIYLISHDKSESSYQKAYIMFEQSLDVDP